MADDDRALDAELLQGLVEQLGLLHRRPDAPARALAVAEAGAVEDDDPVAVPSRSSATPLVFQSSPVTALPWIRTTGCPVPRSL